MNLKEKKLLFIEDDEDLAILMEELLEDNGYKVSIEHNVSNAWKTFKKTYHTLDGIVLDIVLPLGKGIQNMPEIKHIKAFKTAGIYLFREIRKIAPEIPVFVRTGRLTEEVESSFEGQKNLILLCKGKPTELIDVIDSYFDLTSKENVIIIHGHKARVDDYIGSIKFKTALSVDKLACLFKILYNEKLLLLEDGQKSSFCRFIANNFQTLQKEIFSEKNFKNKFDSPEADEQKYWKDTFKAYQII